MIHPAILGALLQYFGYGLVAGEWNGVLGCVRSTHPDPATGGTSCTGCERRIWMFPHFEQMKDAMLLRNSLVPYIYTAARQHYDTGIGLLRPLYYEHPEEDAAYEWASTQYYFGDSIICAPIATPASSPHPLEGTSTKQLWVPAGEWVEWGGEVTHVGPALLSKNYSLGEIPMLGTGKVDLKGLKDLAQAVVQGPALDGSRLLTLALLDSARGGTGGSSSE